MHRTSLALAFVFVALAFSPAAAEGWWNPFGKKETKSTTPKFTVPQQLPKAKPAQPTTWQKMSSGTKNFFDWMNPFDGKTTSNITPTNSKTTAKPFSSASSRPLDSKPTSVPEFLSLPRPGAEK